MHDGSKRAEARSGDHRQRDLADHLAGVPGDDRRAENAVRPLLHHHLGEALLLAVEDGAVDVLEGAHEVLDLDSRFARVALVHADVRDLGIGVIAHVPGVGQRLMDHPSISVSSFIKPECRLNGLTRRHILLALRYSSGIGGAPAGDMFVAGVSKSAWHAVGEQIGSLLAAVYKTFSETGQVKLASRDGRAEPVVEFNLLSDRRDLERLMDGYRRLAAMQLSVALREATSDPFPASYTERVRKIGVVNPKNKVITDVIAKLLDGPAWLRRMMIEKVIVEGYRFDQLMRDEEALEDFIRKAAIGVWHATCTCRMGSDEDPMAVTDNQGRVRGVSGLRVVDASLFPVVPCANTNFPTLMTAEKIADTMLAAV